MYLVTAATQFEMKPFHEAHGNTDAHMLVTGVGPVETAVRTMSQLGELSGQVKGVINFGIGGAYVDPGGSPRAALLDICLAEKEVLGDLGVCLGDGVERIASKGLEAPDTFVMDTDMLAAAQKALQQAEINYHLGKFVTVNCTTGTAARGDILASQYQGICENMEGAAIARACQEFNLPCLEVRCISNLVEDRDTSRWKLKQACKRSAEAASIIFRYLLQENGHD